MVSKTLEIYLMMMMIIIIMKELNIYFLFDEGDVNELIGSCELIEDEDEINDLIDFLEIIFNKTVKITFNESSFKSLISDIRSILPKIGCKKLKNFLNILDN